MGATRRMALAVLVSVLLLAATPRPDRAAGGAPSGLHVAGNRLVDGQGRTVVLHGVDRSGSEYMCAQGQGVFDGPSDDRSVRAIAAWHVDVVRLPLNESCWLGIGGVPAAYAGAAYQRAITAYVELLNAHGMAVILDLAGVNPGQRLLNGQQPLPDRDNAPAFWRSVATAFKANSAVLFDLYNEPHDISWHCWRFGGCHPLAKDKADQPVTYYQAAGMQELVTAIRGTGATNVLMLGGTHYASDLVEWMAYEPFDPLHNLVASWHAYPNACRDLACWNGQIAPLAARVPIIAGEIGEMDCGHRYIDTLMSWLDAHHIGYLGWAWDTHDCNLFPSLIRDYTGTPTAYGIGLRDHLARLSR